MDWTQIIILIAALATIIGTVVGIARSRIAKKPPISLTDNSGVPLWDATIDIESENGKVTTLARLTVSGRTKEEAVHRAGFLLMQWNQIKHGFEWPLDQSLPKDDEGKSLVIIREDLLPQNDGDQLPITVGLIMRSKLKPNFMKQVLNVRGC